MLNLSDEYKKLSHNQCYDSKRADVLLDVISAAVEEFLVCHYEMGNNPRRECEQVIEIARNMSGVVTGGYEQ